MFDRIHSLVAFRLSDEEMQKIIATRGNTEVLEQAAFTRKEGGTTAWYIPIEVWQRHSHQVIHTISIAPDRSRTIEAAMAVDTPCPDEHCARLRNVLEAWLRERGITSLAECASCQEAALIQYLNQHL